MNMDKRHDGTGASEQRAEWLELARRQSQKLARSRGQFVPSFRWESEAGGPATTELRPRFSWSLALLPLLLLGGATGTWAFVHHLKVEARRAEVEQLMTRQVEPAGARVAPARRVGARAATPEMPRVDEAPVPEPEPPARVPVRKPHRAKKVRPEPGAKAPQAASKEAPPEVASKKPQRVIFGTSDAPGEGVIIVPPPVKMRPLFTPESYKKNGRRNAHW